MQEDTVANTTLSHCTTSSNATCVSLFAPLLQCTYDALLDRVQASESELQEGLERLDACCMDGTHSPATMPFTTTRGTFVTIGNHFLGALLSAANCGDLELLTALTLQSTVTFTTKRCLLLSCCCPAPLLAHGPVWCRW